MDQQAFITSGFWNDETTCVLGDGLSAVPDLGDVRGAVLFKTSGSTGNPKWVVHEKRRLLISAKAVNEWLGVDSESVWGLALPIDHMGGFSILARVFQANCDLETYEEKWNAEIFCRWVREKSLTHVSLVPTQVHDLVEASCQAPPNLRAVVVGGGKLSGALGQAARDLGWPVMASYGMTEAASQIATQSLDSLRMPFDQAPLEVLPIWKLECDPEGRVSLSGDALFRGYLLQDENGLRFQPRGEAGFQTNDRGSVSGNHFKPLGRIDTLVKVFGVLVDIELMEQRFSEIAAGKISDQQFAIIALPDSRTEHVLCLVTEGNPPLDCIEIYQSQAPKLERIVKVFQVESMPRSPLKKILRAELVKICEGSDR